MATNTNYKPSKTSDFEASKLNFAGMGVYGECTENTTAYLDLPITDDMLMTGGMLNVKGGDFHDTVSLQVVHPTYGVVNQFVNNYRIIENTQRQFDITLNYPAKIYAGLILRISYTASSTVGTRDISLNYYLHKVLE